MQGCGFNSSGTGDAQMRHSVKSNDSEKYCL